MKLEARRNGEDRPPARRRKTPAPASFAPGTRPSRRDWEPPPAPAQRVPPGEADEPAALLRRLAAAEEERDRLRRTLAERDEQARVLAERLELVSGREADLRAMLLEAHEQLFGADGAAGANGHSPAASAGLAAGRPRPNGDAAVAPPPVGRAAYRTLVGEVRRVVRDVVVPNATVIVVSKGDDELLKLDGRRAWHFPRAETGVYAGHYPADSTAAIEHMESLRARGGQYLLFPGTAFWWFEHYREFKQYLDGRYHAVGDASCVIYKLFKPK